MSNQTKCEDCVFHQKGDLVRLGVGPGKADYVVALAGNPNTGKSTVFNNLTGLRQHTGNWPGKTVTRAEGGLSFNGKQYKLIDLPGTYSLLSTSAEEEVARNFILFGKPDVTVVVVDATRLERNLNLVLQVLEISDRVILCLNLIDEAKRSNIEIDDRSLSRELGIPVVPTAARQRIGMNELLVAIEDVATGRYRCNPRRIKRGSPKLSHAITILSQKLADRFPGLPSTNWIALRLLEGDQRIIEAVSSGEFESYGRH
jgi:ferrous iron transport protein B